MNALAAERPEQAADCLIRAVASDTENAAYCAALTATLTQLGRDADAQASWRRAADLDAPAPALEPRAYASAPTEPLLLPRELAREGCDALALLRTHAVAVLIRAVHEREL